MKYFRYYNKLVENERSVTSYSLLNKIVKIFFFEEPQKSAFTLTITQTLGFFTNLRTPSNGTAVGKATFGKTYSLPG